MKTGELNRAEENMFGGNFSNGDHDWDDGTHESVRKISLTHGACIYSIKVVYGVRAAPSDVEVGVVEADKHGGGGTSVTPETPVELDYPDEFLTKVSGHYGELVEGGDVVIRSLTFFSNKRKFGPYGIADGTEFSSPEGGAYRILGFKGRSKKHLNAIGFHLSEVSSSMWQEITKAFVK